jgi:hypothetical protein
MTFCKKHRALSFTALLFVFSFPPFANAQVPAQTTIVLPAGVDLIWEAESYTPPLYKGKALYPDGGSVRIVAMPDARFGNHDNLFYTWKTDGRVLGSLSGRGRQVFERAGTILGGPLSVSVEVRETPDGPVAAAGVARIPASAPQVLAYEHDPLLGTIFDKALQGTVALEREEITVVAYPYFFSAPARDVLEYEWRVNSRAAGGDKSITLRRGDETGGASVALNVTNPLTILQRAAVTLRITF